MFKPVKSDTYFFPVTVETPIDGGKFEKSTFDAEFKRLSRTQIKSMIDRVGLTAADGSPDPERLTDDEVLDAAFVGWKGIVEDDGKTEIPYSESSRASILEMQGVAGGIVRAWFASLAGSKTKN